MRTARAGNLFPVDGDRDVGWLGYPNLSHLRFAGESVCQAIVPHLLFDFILHSLPGSLARKLAQTALPKWRSKYSGGPLCARDHSVA